MKKQKGKAKTRTAGSCSRPCDDCVGMGMIRREGVTPKKDTRDSCASCGGTGTEVNA